MRARSLKPGFFKNEELAELPPLARILFVGLWCMADREGRLEDRPKRIKAEVLPYDSCSVASLLDLLASSPERFIVRYSVDDKPYIAIPSFCQHQSPHIKEAESTIPAPCSDGTSTIQESLTPDCGLRTTESRSMSGSAKEVFGYWQERLDHPGATFSPERRRRIEARLKEGLTVERLKEAIDGCASSAFHMGDNDSRTVYDSIDLIFRTASKVEEFAGMLKKRRPNEKPVDLRAKAERMARAKAELERGDPEGMAHNFCTADEWEELQCAR